jgi:uncharacterized protein YdeI (BOF family)
MKKGLIVFILFLSVAKVFAQTGIGTTTPNASAKLDVYSTNKGFLPPRVTLTSTTDATTIASPAEGLLVYNLGSVGLQAGYYYWNAANWATIATATSAGNGVTSMDMVKLYGEAWSNATGKIGNTNGYTFTVLVSGKYLFDFSSTGYANAYFTFKVRQTAVFLAVDSQYSYNNTVHVEYNGKVEVNLQAGTTYNVYVNSSGSRDGGDFDRVYYKMVAGNLPVTGQTVEYGLVQYTGPDTSPLTAGNVVPLDATIKAGNITWSGNKFTLKANKTYELESYLALYQTGGWVAGIFQIFDFTNNTTLGNGFFMSMNGIGINSPSGNGPMKSIVTPTSDIQVGIKFISYYGAVGVGAPGLIGTASGGVGANNAAPNQCYFIAKQIGSSAIVNPWVLSGSNSYNTTGNVGIGTSSPTTKLDVTGDMNVTGKINLTDPTGNVAVKVSGLKNAGTYISLDNIKAAVVVSGSYGGLSIGAVSTTFNALISATYGMYGGSSGGGYNGNVSITTTPTTSLFGWGFPTAGDSSTYMVTDNTNSRVYRIIIQINYSFNNNFISIERLL